MKQRSYILFIIYSSPFTIGDLGDSVQDIRKQLNSFEWTSGSIESLRISSPSPVTQHGRTQLSHSVYLNSQPKAS